MSAAFDWQSWLEEGETLLWVRPFPVIYFATIMAAAIAFLGFAFWASADGGRPKDGLVHVMAAFILPFLIVLTFVFVTGLVRVRYGLTNNRMLVLRKTFWKRVSVTSVLLKETSCEVLKGVIVFRTKPGGVEKLSVTLRGADRVNLLDRLITLGVDVR